MNYRRSNLVEYISHCNEEVKNKEYDIMLYFNCNEVPYLSLQ